MKKSLHKGLCLILLFTFILSGCAKQKHELKPNPLPNPSQEIEISNTPLAEMPFDVQVNPENFSLSFKVENHLIPVSEEIENRTVTDYQKNGNTVSWRYPDDEIHVSLTQIQDYLSVEITSENDNNNSFTWPNISSDTYYFPFGEGKRVPAKDVNWQTYLNGQEFNALEQLSMPFWISSYEDYNLLFIMENPYRTKINFSLDSMLAFSVSHEYPAIDNNKTNRFRIYLTDTNPVSAAKLYKNYVIECGNFKTLEQKAASNPNIRKLYGAPFIYLWGEFIISEEDIDWQAFRQAISSPIMDYLQTFSSSVETGNEYLSIINEIKNQDYIAAYQKNVICNYISQLLKQDGFWNPSIFSQSSSKLDKLLTQGYENLSESEKIQVHKYALSENLPMVFVDAEKWMNSSTVNLIHELKEAGIDTAWIGLNSWEQAYAKPELVKVATEQDYLIASYDSYHSIHEPGNEQWITAKFDDTSLYNEATVMNKEGKYESGFQNVGRKLNPTLSLPAVKNRMETIMSNQLSFNSWFIDCDATGEIYDDYTPSHITTQEEDLLARLERMSYIRDQYNFVIGSEGGNDFSASDIAFAHGIELQSFSWIDDDMKINKESPFYIGKYYNPKGGVAEHFSKRIPLKEQYYAVFVNPSYDIPLFKLVYNESVITSYHWDWSTFKIQEATQERMVREVLYNVPPLYHLDADEWENYKEDITNHQSVWSNFSKQAILREMTDFQYVEEDGSVQKTVFGQDLSAVANFCNSAYQYNDIEIPAYSILLQMDGSNTIYTPSISENHL